LLEDRHPSAPRRGRGGIGRLRLRPSSSDTKTPRARWGSTEVPEPLSGFQYVSPADFLCVIQWFSRRAAIGTRRCPRKAHPRRVRYSESLSSSSRTKSGPVGPPFC